MRVYRLRVDGQIVPIKQSTPALANGMTPVISRAKVGHAGEDFTSLPDDLVEKIEAGELEDTWEVIELTPGVEDSEYQAIDEPDSPSIVVPPLPRPTRRARQSSTETTGEDE